MKFESTCGGQQSSSVETEKCQNVEIGSSVEFVAQVFSNYYETKNSDKFRGC